MGISLEDGRLVSPPSSPQHKTIHGYAKLVAMFKVLDSRSYKNLLSKLSLASPLLARLVEWSDFTWWDLERLDDRSIQKVLSVIPERDWLIAWKLATPDVKAILLSNMSAKRQEDFLKAFSEMPKMPKSQVYRVMFQIGVRLRLMAMNGQVFILTRPRRRLKLIKAKETK